MLAMARFAVLLAPMAITTGNLNLETAYRKLKDAAAGKDAVQVKILAAQVGSGQVQPAGGRRSGSAGATSVAQRTGDEGRSRENAVAAVQDRPGGLSYRLES